MRWHAMSPAMAAVRAALSIADADEAAPRPVDEDARLLCWMLETTRPWPESAAGMMQALVDAHRDGLVDAAGWRRLRRAAVALGEHADAELRALGQVAEAAAWPLSSATAGLTEAMRAVGELRGHRSAAATGWTREDDAAARAALDAIAAGDGANPPARGDIPKLFEARHPLLARRFIGQLDATNAAVRSIQGEVAAWIAGASR